MNYRHLLLLTLGFSLALQGTTLSEVEVIGHSPTATQEMPGSADVISEETLQRAQPLTTGWACGPILAFGGSMATEAKKYYCLKMVSPLP
jgi:hypothetical protein